MYRETVKNRQQKSSSQKPEKDFQLSSRSMDPPADGIGLQPEKLEEEKEGGPLFHCDLCDADVVYKIAQAFLPSLASACIDNTTGGLFKTPATVAVELRREMVDYLIQRSENFVAESVVLEGGPDVEESVDPYDVISDFLDDFVGSKRNFFSRVSGWLLSDKREDWIDDLVQEMELNGFWLLNRRNTVAQTLLKNLDFKHMYHCSMKFRSGEDLEKHKSNCSFRTMSCTNEGCDSTFSAAQLDHHDSICPFKMLQCEQNCPDIIMRREMDRHCITICPMKLVKCPFYSVGCQSTVPQCTIEQHRSESLPCHLLYVLQVLHKGASPDDLKERVKELEQLSSPGRLASARDARSLTFAIKDLEAKLGPLKVKRNAKCDEQDKDLIENKEEKTDKLPKHVRFEELNSPSNGSNHEESNHGNRELIESSTSASAPSKTDDEVVSSISVQENLKESPVQREEALGSPAKVDEEMGKASIEKVVDPIEGENLTTELVAEKEKHTESTARNEMFTESPSGEVSSCVTTIVKDEMPIDSPPSSSVTTTVKDEMPIDSPPREVSSSVTTTIKDEMPIDSPPEEVSSSVTTTVKDEMPIDSPPGKVSSSVTTTVKNEMSIESPPGEEHLGRINREVGPGKEETDSSNSGLRAENVEN